MSKQTIELYKIGTEVKLAEDIVGTVIGIHIGHNNSIIYNCGWWNGRSYCTQEFMPEALDANDAPVTKIGFV